MLNLFIDKTGNLNRNWKRIVEKHGMPELSVKLGYPNDVMLKLAILGKTELDKCPTCESEVDIGKAYCSRKCSASDPTVKTKKLSSIDTKARGKKISKSLKGRNDYHAKCWETRREKYGTGFSETGLKNIRNQLGNIKHVSEWVYDKDEFSKIYNTHGLDGTTKLANCGPNLIYKLSLSYGLREKNRSIAESEIKEYINSIGIDCLLNDRSAIRPLELDVFIPSRNLAIEYNGIYWHSSGSKEHDSYMKSKHITKTELCEAQGIHLLHIFENEWLFKKDIWKSVIAHKLGKSKKVYARNCVIKDISNKDANDFCEENHLQGRCVANFSKGLFYNNELVQVATFGKPRFNNDSKLELIRLCSKKYHCVVGGASKLLKNMDLISYANRRWSYGNVYEQLGMTKVRVTPPCYYYVDLANMAVNHRSSHMKHKLSAKLGIFDPTKTEVENCYANGLRRIWDCGNILYEKRTA